MYIHLGSDRMIRSKTIVGIFDLDGEITTPDTKEFLRDADKKGITTLAGDDLPRSFVLVSSEEGEEVVFSRLTSHALASRGEKAERKKEITRSFAENASQTKEV